MNRKQGNNVHIADGLARDQDTKSESSHGNLEKSNTQSLFFLPTPPAPSAGGLMEIFCSWLRFVLFTSSQK